MVQHFFDHVKKLQSIQIGNKNMPAKVDSVVFVGSSCAGKSTLLDIIRTTHELSRSLEIPKRFVTRPVRDNDNFTENAHLSFEELNKKINAGEVSLYWQRKFGTQKIAYYGFQTPKGGKLIVYSGNNALLTTENVKPPGALANSLFVGIYAPDSVREERLVERNPDLYKTNLDEVGYRLSDSSEGLHSRVHFVVNNYGEYINHCKLEVIFLLKEIVKCMI